MSNKQWIYDRAMNEFTIVLTARNLFAYLLSTTLSSYFTILEFKYLNFIGFVFRPIYSRSNPIFVCHVIEGVLEKFE